MTFSFLCGESAVFFIPYKHSGCCHRADRLCKLVAGLRVYLSFPDDSQKNWAASDILCDKHVKLIVICAVQCSRRRK